MGALLVPCGQCLVCRINKRREWLNRLLLESTQHAVSSIWTLTYAENQIRLSPSGTPTLVKRDCQNFLKRVRKRFPRKVRFFLAGEYGEMTQRPHYHVVLFGYLLCIHVRTLRDLRGQPDAVACCPHCALIREAWPHGHIEGGQFTDEYAQYVCGYVIKKMGSDFVKCDRVPEFSLKSLRPALGSGFIPEIASELLRLNVDLTDCDIPVAVRHGRKVLPLGRTLRLKLREQVFGHADASQLQQMVKAEQMRIVPQDKTLDADAQKKLVQGYYLDLDGLRARAESRERLYNERKKI